MNLEERSIRSNYEEQIGVAIFNITDTGPNVVNYHMNEHIMGEDNLRGFAVYSVITTTQGSHYSALIAQLPVPWNKNFHAILCSFVVDGEEEIHERYYQVGIFLPDEYLELLPNIVTMKVDLFEIINSMSSKKIEEMRSNLVNYIRQFILEQICLNFEFL